MNGVGEVKGTPDLAIVTIGVEVSGTTVAETNENGATAAANLIAFD